MPLAIRVLCALVLSAAAYVPTQTFASTTGTTATYYHPSLQGFRMANGLPYNRWDPMIAANNWYPLGTLLKVTRQGTDQYIYVRVQDRGSRSLTLDLSEAGFAHLGGLGEGRIPIWLEVVNSIEGQAPRSVAGAPEDDAAPDTEAPTDELAAPEADTPSNAPLPAEAAGETNRTLDRATTLPATADATTEPAEAADDPPTAPVIPDTTPLARHIRAIMSDEVPGLRVRPI